MAGPCTTGFWKWTVLLLIVTTAAVAAQGYNIALGKSAIQSSTRSDYVASRAVDGNTDTNIDHGSCTHTNSEANPFWRVDLGQTYRVGSVVIFNRRDCCSDRLNPFNIHIGDSDEVSNNPRCGGVHNINLKQVSITVSCNMSGRYVGIQLVGDDRILSLCEVEVFEGYNIAFGKSAIQISTFRDYVASRAVDGNTDVDLDHGSCTQTQREANPFWRVDLGRSHPVDRQLRRGEKRLGSYITARYQAR